MLAHMREKIWGENHSGHKGGLEILRWVGPGLLVTVGFIDPGNWATKWDAMRTDLCSRPCSRSSASW